VVCGSVRLPGDNDMDNESVMQPLSKNLGLEKKCRKREGLPYAANSKDPVAGPCAGWCERGTLKLRGIAVLNAARQGPKIDI
jgi:hypothetical protein